MPDVVCDATVQERTATRGQWTNRLYSHGRRAVLLVGLSLALVLLSSPRPSLTGRRLGVMRVNPAMLDVTVQQIAAPTQVPFGVELVGAAAVPDLKTAAPIEATLDFTGLSVRQALERLVAAAPAYAWRELSAGIIVVRPREREPNGHAWLNQRVASFEVNKLPVRDAIYAVHRLFDPRLTVPSMMPKAVESLQRRDALNAAVNQPISISLRNATVLQILNAIALAHGRLGWKVAYRDGQAVPENATITVFSWDGWTMSAEARPLAARRGRGWSSRMSPIPPSR